ncbi:MAG: NAD-binding protein [Actinobacteria bacterium]|nr:NAD-binding protein [Actinomycetota bacterium]
MHVLIVGGGIVGSFLARILMDKHEVTVIDKDPARYDYLKSTLPGMTVVSEDGCEPWVLEFAKIKDADLVLAVTGDDEDNLVIGYLSKFEYDVPKVIARVNNPVNRWLFTKSWGVDVEVSTPDIIATVIEEEVSLGEVITVMKLQSGDIGLVEITLSPDAKALGEHLAELELPPETLIVTVVREDEMLIPRADTVLQPGDRVLAITDIHNKEALEKLLGHRP